MDYSSDKTTGGMVVVVLLERLLNVGINLEIERSLNVNPLNMDLFNVDDNFNG